MGNQRRVIQFPYLGTKSVVEWLGKPPHLCESLNVGFNKQDFGLFLSPRCPRKVIIWMADVLFNIKLDISFNRKYGNAHNSLKSF